MKSALITGGAGFVGGRLARTLVAEGVRVTILDNLATGSMHNVPPNVSVHVHDVAQPWPELPAFDVCFHLAAVSRIGLAEQNPDRTTKVNVGGTLKALLRSQKQEAKLVFASSCTAAEPDLNAYAKSKADAERLCAIHADTFGPQSVAVARLFNVYGPGEPAEGPTATLVAKARRARTLGVPLEVRGGGLQRRDFVHVDDVVSALRLLATSETEPKPYDVGEGYARSVRWVAEVAGVATVDAPLAHPEMKKAEADPEPLMALGWFARNTVRDWLQFPESREDGTVT